MEADQFLSRVLPDSGTYCVVGINQRRRLFHEFSTNLAQLAHRALEFSDNDTDAYFALATFSEANAGRTQDNACYLKSFFLDLDVDPNDEKKYKSKKEAVATLRAFCLDKSIPTPMIVDSGRGLHAYWPLTSPIGKGAWYPVARALKKACKAYGMKFDAAVPADSARILRVPGTRNYKNPDSPLTVKVLRECEDFDFELIRSKFDIPDVNPFAEPSKLKPATMSGLMQTLTSYNPSKFKKILLRTKNGTGCKAMAYITKNQTDVEEPLWRAGLSIAHACTDGAQAIHFISKKHPGYSEADTEKKAAETKGPYLCETISDLRPELCEGCPHWGKIKSPIVLGSYVEEDTRPREGNRVEEIKTEQGVLHLTREEHTDLPKGYFRGQNGAIYRKSGSEAESDVVVYQNELYATRRLFDPDEGESIVFKLVLPMDGEKEFVIPLADMTAKDSLRKTLASHGVAAFEKELTEILRYAIMSTKHLQSLYKAQPARQQFGWADGNESFVVGDRTYRKNGKVEHNPASSITRHFMDGFEPKGTLTEWRKMINHLDAPNMEPFQFAALCGFGSPLLKFTGTLGVVVNLISNDSGAGKSTAEMLGMGVFCDPRRLSLQFKDTVNARPMRFGMMNSLFSVVDEMTNPAPEEISDFLYLVSQGRGKARLEASANRERVNNTSWQNIIGTNSNSSMRAKLANLKARADGELMRIMEFDVNGLFMPNGAEVYGSLSDHCGVAGEVYAPWLVDNAARLPELIDVQKKELYDLIGNNPPERFWISASAAVLVGATIAKELKLHDLNIGRLKQWICHQFKLQREYLTDAIIDATGMLGEFLNEHSNGILGVGNKLNAMTGDNIFMPARSNEVVARYEAGDRKMFISKRAFREYCVSRQFTLQNILDETQAASMPMRFIGHGKKRLMAGTGIAAPPVDVLEFICTEEEALHLEASIAKVSKPSAD